MATFLFDQMVFGPVRSRRLGVSLGINLLPVDRKICSFDCIYCECGLNQTGGGTGRMPARIEVVQALEARLVQMTRDGELPDVITFAGNGEPTMHNEFPAIVDDVLALRDRYCAKARVAVLSNASRLDRPGVFEALLKVDDNIQKLDAGFSDVIARIDRPNYPFSLDQVVDQLQRFQGQVVIQTMFIAGEADGLSADNTKAEQLQEWLALLKKIAPRQVMIYTIERDTPFSNIQKVNRERLEEIAAMVRPVVSDVVVSG